MIAVPLCTIGLLGTPAGLCDGPRQSRTVALQPRTVALQRIASRRESHPQKTPAITAQVVGSVFSNPLNAMEPIRGPVRPKYSLNTVEIEVKGGVELPTTSPIACPGAGLVLMLTRMPRQKCMPREGLPFTATISAIIISVPKFANDLGFVSSGLMASFAKSVSSLR